MTQEPAMSADAEAETEIRVAREIIAGFLLWHAPAYKRLPSVSLVDLLDEAKRFMNLPVQAPLCKRRPCKCDAGCRVSSLF
jgi:hypothetical protein